MEGRISLVSEWSCSATRMEGRTSRSLSELAEEGAGEENSLLGNREGEKVTSLDTLVPEEEVEAPLSVKQVHIMSIVIVK